MRFRPSRQIRDAVSPRRTRSLTWTLILSFGGLIAITVLGVLAMVLYSAGRNTVDLLQDKGRLTVDHIVAQVDTVMGPPRDQVILLARSIAEGDISPRRPEEFARALSLSLGGVPQVRGVAFFDAELRMTGVLRRQTSFQRLSAARGDDPNIRTLFGLVSHFNQPEWSAPIFLPEIGQTALLLRYPVRRDDRVIGMLVAVIDVQRLSDDLRRFTEDIEAEGFILHGQDRVLAHASLVMDAMGASEAEPLPHIERYGDRVLSRLWDEAAREELAIGVTPPLRGHVVLLGEERDEAYVFLYRMIDRYGDTPWIVGAYVPAETIGQEVQRLISSAVVGLVAFLIAIAMAVYIGRRISRPVRRLANAARQISDLRVEDVEPIPPSRITELNEQSNAFNAMVSALGWFGNYVPRRLVGQLLKYGDVGNLQSDERALTVMFTDIAGYSTLAEGQTASDVARFLNHHFDIVTAAIEAEEGTVDKYIGDSVMAFWGAPEKQKNRATRACRAALAIRKAIEADNDRREAAGEPRVRMRIGLHSGRATVGNIGSRDRVNYTIIGDTVNVAQRMEQLAREADYTQSDVAIYMSEATKNDVGDRFRTASAGDHPIRGRAEHVTVYSLLGPKS